METPVESNPAVDRLESPPPSAAAWSLPWPSIAWVAVAIFAGFYPMLERLVRQWIDDGDMSHGFFVPLVSGYLVWTRKDEILAASNRRNYWGLAIMAVAAVQYVLGHLAAELFINRTSLILSLAGMAVFIGSWGLLRILAFPLALLLFMVPIPAVIYNRITFPLQLFASRVAEVSLLIAGIPVIRDGNVLELAENRLSVVEACSGIRSLLSLTFLSLVYGYFYEKSNAIRATLLIATVPIAIAANAFRVSMTGFLYEYKREWAEGFFHSAEGWVIFMFALSLLLGLHRLILWFQKGIAHARAQSAASV
jgi:exosortase